MDGAITQLVELAREVGGEAWPMLVKHTLADAWISVVWYPTIALILILISAISIFLLKKYWEFISEKGIDEILGPACCILVIITVLYTLVILFAIPSEIVTIMVPEGAVLKSLLASAKG